MSKSILPRQEARRQEEREREEERGRQFRVLWDIDGRQYGPLYFATDVEAKAKLEEVASESKQIPSDYYERQAALIRFDVWVERFDSTRWVQASPRFEGVWNIRYVD